MTKTHVLHELSACKCNISEQTLKNLLFKKAQNKTIFLPVFFPFRLECLLCDGIKTLRLKEVISTFGYLAL